MATPATLSQAYKDMMEDWRTISDILNGETAIKAATVRYLPKYPDETTDEYNLRLNSTPWQPEFEDALNTISAKPFNKDVILKTNNPPDKIKQLYENIDTRGNSLTIFAQNVFRQGIAYGQHHIFIDMPRAPSRPTALTDRQATPYWTHISATDMIALYTTVIGNVEYVSHCRFFERSTVVKEFEEVAVLRIRELNQTATGPTWVLWEQKEKEENGKKEQYWDKVDQGDFVGIPYVPLVSFFTGERQGSQYALPPLRNLAGLQIDLFRSMARKEEIETFAGSPMVTANGFTLPEGEVIKLGPRQVLVAPPGLDGQPTSWDFIQPDASNIQELRKSVEEKIDNIRRLGLQPLTTRSGRPTATGQSIEGAKAHTTVQQWAQQLNDVLERGMEVTTTWLGLPNNIETEVSTDFYVIPYQQAPLDALTKARERGDISQHTFWLGLKRFDVLPPDFDEAEEVVRLAKETPQLEDEEPAP